MGGWVAPHMACRMQRTDEGQDFEIPMGHHLVAPGAYKVIMHGSDRDWPSGFGNPYAVVEIFTGKFASKINGGDSDTGRWYLGHANGDVPPVGKTGHRGEILSRPNHGFDPNWGWTELGEWGPNGPTGQGAKYHHLFVPVWLVA